MGRTYTRRPVIDRVMDKVVEQDGHWLWTGSVGSSGYGKIGEGGNRGRDLLTHRVVWEHHNGPIPDGLVLDHIDECLTIRCCNPAHLEPVTQAENRRRQSLRRTSCKAGHPYTPESTYVGPNGRECRICNAERESQRRARARARGLTSRGAPIDTPLCRQGRHVRTPENTAVFGDRITCRDCMSESAKTRHHRPSRVERGSGAPAS